MYRTDLRASRILRTGGIGRSAYPKGGIGVGMLENRTQPDGALFQGALRTPRIQDIAVTKLNNAFSGAAISVDSLTDGTDTEIQSVAIKRRAGTQVDINVGFNIVIQTGVTAPLQLTVEVYRGITQIYAFIVYVPIVDAGAGRYGGPMFFGAVDEDEVSGDVTYSVTLEFFHDIFGTPTAIDRSVSDRYLRILERAK